jgi:hypothetical protein
MIKNRCIDCKCKESAQEKPFQQPFQHLYCSLCYAKKKWFSKFKEGTSDWTYVMFDRSAQQDARNGTLMKSIFNKE